jgi:hypothetical protein
MSPVLSLSPILSLAVRMVRLPTMCFPAHAVALTTGGVHFRGFASLADSFDEVGVLRLGCSHQMLDFHPELRGAMGGGAGPGS